MYAPPNSGNVAARTVGPAIGALCCGACFLFLVAATIVLAIIPVYTPTKTATLNPVTLEANGREKRLSPVKRQISSIVVLAIKFVIFFAKTCDYRCQLKVGPIFKSLLQNNLPSALFLINVPILNTNGELMATIASIPIIEVLFLTNIYPGRYPFVAPTLRPTITVTKATKRTTKTTITTTTPVRSVNIG
ncbi:unnamed protein product [Rotaria sordida]|uniref:Uncharacterized protein n=1 Tax=Rotaria sordida TaxID=392033 RepID=A0A815IWZ7_9BILA|nr:unnamed protein product [Rotaria sordida]